MDPVMCSFGRRLVHWTVSDPCIVFPQSCFCAMPAHAHLSDMDSVERNLSCVICRRNCRSCCKGFVQVPGDCLGQIPGCQVTTSDTQACGSGYKDVSRVEREVLGVGPNAVCRVLQESYYSLVSITDTGVGFPMLVLFSLAVLEQCGLTIIMACNN